MSVRGNVVAGAASAVIGLVACGNSVPSLTPGPGGLNNPNNATNMGSDDAYASCKDQEKLGDASTCWKKWLADNGNTGDTPQKDYAKMYVSHHVHPDLDPTPVGGGKNGPKPNPDDSKHGPVKVIPIDTEAQHRTDNPGPSTQWPQKSVGDKECWDHMKLTGKYVDDYNELIARCGKPTGMLPFSKPVQGELSQDHKGDVYTLKLVGGGCYRLFAVADSGVHDLDVAIATMENKVVWIDKNHQAVAIVDWDKAVCVEKDVQFKFVVALEGAGAGGYGFGIWVRPNGG